MREALTVGAAPIFGLIEAGAANLPRVSTALELQSADSCRIPCGDGSIYMLLLFVDAAQAAEVRTPFVEAAHTGRHTAVAVEAGRGIDRVVVASVEAARVPVASIVKAMGSVSCRLCQQVRRPIMMDRWSPFCWVVEKGGKRWRRMRK